MANQFTSIATGGYSDNTVKQAYDLVFGWALNVEPIYRQFVSKRPEQVSWPSNSVLLQKYAFLDEAAVTAAMTPLTEEQDVDARKSPATTTITLGLSEYGDATVRTKLIKMFSMGDIDMAAMTQLVDQCSKVVDGLVQVKLRAGTSVLRPSSRATTGAVTATDKFDSTTLRKAITKLRRTNAVPWDGKLYAVGCHPDQIHDLREETGAAAWRDPQVYGVSQDRLWAGEVGVYEGARFFENARTYTAMDGASGIKVYRSYVMGQEAIAESMAEEPNVVVGPEVDKLRRFRTLGWTFIGGWELYRDEALVRLETGSSMALI